LLLKKIIRYCTARGTGVLTGAALAGNARMLVLARELGFTITHDNDAGVMRMVLRLPAAGAA
jgi:hypothetical protein